MSALERRLQLLLDQERYAMVEAEARRSERSVAAVIREAIDWRFASDARVRAAAARRLLAATEAVEGVEPDWGQVKVELSGAAKLEQAG